VPTERAPVVETAPEEETTSPGGVECPPVTTYLTVPLLPDTARCAVKLELVGGVATLVFDFGAAWVRALALTVSVYVQVPESP